jgi:hypothetical protein
LAPDGTRWIPARSSRFLFPVRALATVFRAKFLAALDRAFASHHLTFAGGTAASADPTAFARFRAALRTVPWVVYAKRPFAGPAQVLAYLGRYTHRVALTNQRLVACDAGQVSHPDTRPPYNPHSAAAGHAVSSNRVYPHGPATASSARPRGRADQTCPLDR